MIDLSKLKVAATWMAARSEVREEVLKLLGKLPKEHAELQVKVIDEIDFPGFVRKRINYFVDNWTRISAWLFVPEGDEEWPAIVCCHQEVPQGKEQMAGLEGPPSLALAKHFAELGFVTIAPDCITAGERISHGLQAYDTTAFYKEHKNISLAGKMLADHMHAVDVLAETPKVDPSRIGVVGHGLGGLNALMLVAFDERLAACASSCGFTRFAQDTDPTCWGSENEIQIFQPPKNDKEPESPPFDWEHILALGAPSPTLVVTSLKNAKNANPKSCKTAVAHAKKLYKALGAASAIDHSVHDEGDIISPTTASVMEDWMERWL
jgi:dienelactone hydrolase